jgi:hypothetical protein
MFVQTSTLALLLGGEGNDLEELIICSNELSILFLPSPFWRREK